MRKPTETVSFTSIAAFGEHIAECERNGTRGDGCSSQSDKPESRDWDRGLGLDGAVSMARSGGYWSEGAANIRPIELDVGALATDRDFDAPEWFAAPHGYLANVPAALAGVPDAMWTIEDHPIPDKMIKVGVSVVHSCSTSDAAIFRRGNAILSVVDALETLGYACEIWAVYRSWAGSAHPSVDVLVKDAADRWDPASVAFALCHSAFGRRLGFRMMETETRWRKCASGGYGNGVDVDWSMFDVAFGYQTGDEGFTSDLQAIKTVLDAFVAGVKAKGL